MHKNAFLPLVLCLLLGGCASSSSSSSSSPSWLPKLSMPDFSSWFTSEYEVEVQEIARADVCFTPGGEAEVTKLPTLGALEAWAKNRNVVFQKQTVRELEQNAAYAVVEFGQREHSGYGLVVSKQAGLRNGSLVLKGTFFEPTPGRWVDTTPSSPCVVVSLPLQEYRDIRVLDQNGRVRAATEGAS